MSQDRSIRHSQKRARQESDLFIISGNGPIHHINFFGMWVQSQNLSNLCTQSFDCWIPFPPDDHEGRFFLISFFESHPDAPCRLNPPHFFDQGIKLRTGGLSPCYPPQSDSGSRSISLDQEPKHQVHRITGLHKAEDGWGGNGGHQAAGEFVSHNGGVGDGRAVHIISGCPQDLGGGPGTVVNRRTQIDLPRNLILADDRRHIQKDRGIPIAYFDHIKEHLVFPRVGNGGRVIEPVPGYGLGADPRTTGKQQ